MQTQATILVSHEVREVGRLFAEHDPSNITSSSVLQADLTGSQELLEV